MKNSYPFSKWLAFTACAEASLSCADEGMDYCVAERHLRKKYMDNAQLKYDTNRKAFGTHPYKLAYIYRDEVLVAKVFFLDFLYQDGRVIYVPTFNLHIEGEDAMFVRLEAHRRIEEETCNRIGSVNLVSKYTDTHPQTPLYWDNQNYCTNDHVDEFEPEQKTAEIATEVMVNAAEESSVAVSGRKDESQFALF